MSWTGCGAALFTGIRAAVHTGHVVALVTFGHVRQLDNLAARVLVNLARHTPLLRDANRVCFVDNMVKPTYGYDKQGAGKGYTGVKGLNALIGTLSPRHRRGDRRDPAPEGSTSSPRCVLRGLNTDDGEAAWRSRAGGGPDGLSVLHHRRRRRGQPGRRPVLHHRPAERLSPREDRHHRRGRVDPDPLPERDLG
jgi:hypothetical protein